MKPPKKSDRPLDWLPTGQSISRVFIFKNFQGSIDFVNRVARCAEEDNHHPDIDIRWDKVTLTFSTHSEGKVTEKDYRMSAKCDEIYSATQGSS
ncbi:MAG: 4a-hydroxytetrahydrobiopterin dehydratase [Candidatus Taylorbacteria bacterium]